MDYSSSFRRFRTQATYPTRTASARWHRVRDMRTRGRRPGRLRVHPAADGEREPDVDWITAVHPGQRCNMCARELGVEDYLGPDNSLGMPS